MWLLFTVYITHKKYYKFCIQRDKVFDVKPFEEVLIRCLME